MKWVATNILEVLLALLPFASGANRPDANAAFTSPPPRSLFSCQPLFTCKEFSVARSNSTRVSHRQSRAGVHDVCASNLRQFQPCDQSVDSTVPACRRIELIHCKRFSYRPIEDETFPVNPDCDLDVCCTVASLSGLPRLNTQSETTANPGVF